MSNDKKIADVLAKFSEPMAGNVWRVQGTAVIYHKALERIAAAAKITFDPPTIIRAERDEAIILVTGRMGDRVEWSIGEALVGVNYRVSGKQAAYVFAMSEKRGKDRVILKLIELAGEVYSEEEADDFKKGRPGAQESPPEPEPEPAEPEPDEQDETDQMFASELRKKIDAAKTGQDVIDLMSSAATQLTLETMSVDPREAVREYGKTRVRALGWQSKKAS